MAQEIFIKSINLQHEINAMKGILPQSDYKKIDNKELFNTLITDSNLRKLVWKLFEEGHHARAVEEAYKYIDNLVKKRAGLSSSTLTGAKLMNKVFNNQNPILKINAYENASDRDEQLGYMEILSGCMTGIRNPRAHECDWEDEEQRALQLLIIANHLIERIKLSEINK